MLYDHHHDDDDVVVVDNDHDDNDDDDDDDDQHHHHDVGGVGGRGGDDCDDDPWPSRLQGVLTWDEQGRLGESNITEMRLGQWVKTLVPGWYPKRAD